MNTTISQNNTELIKEIFLKVIGSSWLYDSMYLFIITPMGIVGTILNLISLKIFTRKEFHKMAIFKYFQIYVLNSLILSATLSCAFFMSPRHLFAISTSYSARIYKCLLLPSYVLALFLFFGNSMGVLVNLERISNFSPAFKKFKTMSPYLSCLILLIICVIINLPTYFLITPNTDEQVSDALLSYENVIKFKGVCLRNPISLTLWGKVISIFGYSVKGVLVLVLDIISNSVSIYYLRDYFVKKRNLASNSTSLNQNKKQVDRAETSKLNHTYMTIYLTLFAIVMHLIIFAADLVIFFFSSNTAVLFAFTFLTFFIVAFKQIINFVFFYLFNRKFRDCVERTIRLEPNGNSSSLNN